MLLLKGHPGSGKSTVAKQIAVDLQMALSDKDDSRDCLRAAETQHGSAEHWDLNALAYEIMFRVAETQLSCGQSVVVDCPLSKAQLYHTAFDIAQKHRAEVAVIECQPCDKVVWQQRLEARSQTDHGGSSSHKPSSWSELTALIARYNRLDEWTSDGTVSLQHYMLLDTSSGSTAEHLVKVKKFLRREGLARHLL